MSLLEAAGSRERAEEAADHHMASALATLDQAVLPHDVRQQWLSLINSLSRRRR